MIVLQLPYPISANRYWASRVVPIHGKPMPMVYVTSEAKAYRAQVDQIVADAGIAKPITGRVAIQIRLFPQRPQDWRTRQRKHADLWDDDVRCIDLDNANKVLLDCLKGVVIEDDKWVRRLQSERMEPDEHGARVVVAIAQIPRVVVQGRLIPDELVVPC